MTRFLESIEDFDTFADVAAFNMCDDDEFKQRLLEELDTTRRLQLFATQLKTEIGDQRLRRRMNRLNHLNHASSPPVSSRPSRAAPSAPSRLPNFQTQAPQHSLARDGHVRPRPETPSMC